MLVPLKDVAVFDRIRKSIDLSKINDLAESLKTDGQLQPVIVRRPDEHDDPEQVKGKPWVLVIGGRRTMAAALIEWTEIWAEERDSLSPYTRLKLELTENLQREDMHPADVAETKLRLHELYLSENPNQTLRETAFDLKESIANLSRDITYAKAVRKNPKLRHASSKKAALHAVKMEDYGKARQMEMGSRIEIETFRAKMETADMKDWIRQREDASCDLVMTDLPYGLDYFDMPVGESGDLSKYDDSSSTTRDLVTDVVPQFLRVTKVSGWLAMFTGWEGYFHVKDLVATCCVEHYEYLDTSTGANVYCLGRKPGQAKCRYLRMAPKPWIWFRPNSRNNSLHPDLHAQNQYEPILIINRGEAKIVSTVRVGNVLVHDADYSNRLHEMQKPIPLWEDILERLSLMGAMVYDPCFGSGTSMAACAKDSRDFRGCDNNPMMLAPARGLVSEFYKGA